MKNSAVNKNRKECSILLLTKESYGFEEDWDSQSSVVIMVTSEWSLNIGLMLDLYAAKEMILIT